MHTLADLQSDFQSFLLQGGEGLRRRIVSTEKVDAWTRLAIYYDAYRLRLLDALAANYPVLRAWIGAEAFEPLGIAYLDAWPSRHFSIRWFGHRLAEQLAANFPDRPYWSEMASLEWALSEAFDAADGTVIKIDEMAVVPAEAWPGMRLQFHPSVRRLDLRWNVPPIWKAIDPAIETQANACRGENSAMPAAEERIAAQSVAAADIPALEAAEHPQSWLIWRQDLKTWFRSLSVDEAWALDAMRAGENFASVCEGLCEWIDAQHVARHAAGLMKQWISDGLVSGTDFGTK